jgi:hypothetical protein
MKSLLLIGGYLGFAGGVAFSFIQKESWLACLEHGATAAILASVMLPWLDRAWQKHCEELASDRQSSSDSLLSTSTQPKTSKS